jgi:hypothetical protein
VLFLRAEARVDELDRGEMDLHHDLPLRVKREERGVDEEVPYLLGEVDECERPLSSQSDGAVRVLVVSEMNAPNVGVYPDERDRYVGGRAADPTSPRRSFGAVLQYPTCSRALG